MPWWPIAPGLALLAMIYVASQLPARELLGVGALVGLSLLYYYSYLARAPHARWLMKAAPE